MVLGICTIEIHIPYAGSLKHKRRVVKSIIQRVRNKYNVSVSEIDKQDVWRLAVLGIACISNDKNIVYKTFSGVEKFIESTGDVRITDLYTEIM